MCCLAASAYTCSSIPRSFGRCRDSVDRWLDSPRLIKAFADRSVSTDPRLLGGLTISMLEGTGGVLRKEFDKLLEWTAGEPAPDIINLTNSMLIALARPMAEAFGRPVCCTLQGEDLFLDGLIEPYRTRARDLIRQQIRHVDRFVAVSDYYAGFMARYLQIPADAISVVPLGINVAGFERRTASDGVFRVGYFARLAPEKGLHVLADAFQAPSATHGRGAHPPRGGRVSGSRAQGVSRRCRAVARARRARRRLRLSGRRRPRRKVGVSAGPGCSLGAGDLRRAERHFSARGDGERCARRAAAARRLHRDCRANGRRAPCRARRRGEPD